VRSWEKVGKYDDLWSITKKHQNFLERSLVKEVTKENLSAEMCNHEFFLKRALLHTCTWLRLGHLAPSPLAENSRQFVLFSPT